MTTLQLTRHAAQQPTTPRVFLKEQGFQPGFGTLPGRMLYNVVGGDYITRFDCDKETMVERGFKVEVVK